MIKKNLDEERRIPGHGVLPVRQPFHVPRPVERFRHFQSFLAARQKGDCLPDGEGKDTGEGGSFEGPTVTTVLEYSMPSFGPVSLAGCLSGSRETALTHSFAPMTKYGHVDILSGDAKF